jgi:hypothetical protein
MGNRNGSFFERLISSLVRGNVPIDASQCDGPCVVNGPADAGQTPCDRDSERRDPIRWVSLR